MGHDDRIEERPVDDWRRLWPLILVSALGYGIGVSHLSFFGVLLPAVQRDTGWSRGSISGGLTIVSIAIISLSPVMGLAIDRYGSRRIALVGSVAFGGAFVVLSLAAHNLTMWLVCWTLIGIAALTVKPTVWTKPITRAFDRNRATALALMLCGGGISSSIMPFITVRLIAAFGWRGAYMAIGMGMMCLLIPSIWLFFRGAATSSEIARSGAGKASLTGILRSRDFLVLAGSILLLGIALQATLVHFFSILTGAGIANDIAGAMLGVIGLSSIVARLVTGVLLDRLPGKVIGGIAFSAPAIACLLLLLLPGQTAPSIAAVLIVGISLGAEVDIIAFLGSRYFGTERFGFVFGVLISMLGIGTGIGPLATGAAYDYFGSYDVALVVIAALYLAAGLTLTRLGPDPRFLTLPTESR